MINGLVDRVLERVRMFSGKRLGALTLGKMPALLSLAQKIGATYLDWVDSLLSRFYLSLISASLLDEDVAFKFLPVSFVWFDKRQLYCRRKRPVPRGQLSQRTAVGVDSIPLTLPGSRGFAPLGYSFTEDTTYDGVFELSQLTGVEPEENTLRPSVLLVLSPANMDLVQQGWLTKRITSRLEPPTRQGCTRQQYALFGKVARWFYQNKGLVAEDKLSNSLITSSGGINACQLVLLHKTVSMTTDSIPSEELSCCPATTVSLLPLPDFLRRLFGKDTMGIGSVELPQAEAPTAHALRTPVILPDGVAVEPEISIVLSSRLVNRIPKSMSQDKKPKGLSGSTSVVPDGMQLREPEKLFAWLDGGASFMHGRGGGSSSQHDNEVRTSVDIAHLHCGWQAERWLSHDVPQSEDVLKGPSPAEIVLVGPANGVVSGQQNNYRGAISSGVRHGSSDVHSMGKGTELALAPVGRTIENTVAMIPGNMTTWQEKASQTVSQATPGIDAEVLALEVYSIIKHRLLLERERTWSLI